MCRQQRSSVLQKAGGAGPAMARLSIPKEVDFSNFPAVLGGGNQIARHDTPFGPA